MVGLSVSGGQIKRSAAKALGRRRVANAPCLAAQTNTALSSIDALLEKK
jgi:hypothetical protein